MPEYGNNLELNYLLRPVVVEATKSGSDITALTSPTSSACTSGILNVEQLFSHCFIVVHLKHIQSYFTYIRHLLMLTVSRDAQIRQQFRTYYS